GVEHQARLVLGVGQRPQRPHQQEVVLDHRLAFLGGEPLGGLEDRRCRGVAPVVVGDVNAAGGDGLGLGDDVEGTAGGQLHVDGVHVRSGDMPSMTCFTTRRASSLCTNKYK